VRTVACTARLLGAALAIAVMAAAGPAAAQRGEDFAPDGELAVAPNPNQGFPGLLDTEVAPKGAFVANLPATSLYYGVTSRLTVGTIGASYVSVVAGPPGASITARYLLGGATWFRGTIDALMLSGAFVGADEQVSVRVGLFGSNTQLALSPRHRVTVHGWLAHATMDQPDSASTAGTAFLVGATYSVSLAPWAALHVTGLFVASVTGSVDAPGTSLDIDATNGIRGIDRVVARATVSLRRGRWLFDLGAFRAGSFYAPWLNVAVQMGS
jgi:hypothetical protein